MTTHASRRSSHPLSLDMRREAARDRTLFWVATFTGLTATLTAVAALMVGI